MAVVLGFLVKRMNLKRQFKALLAEQESSDDSLKKSIVMAHLMAEGRTEKKVKMLFDYCDDDDWISLREFRLVMGVPTYNSEKEGWFRHKFRALDRNGDGKVDIEDFKIANKEGKLGLDDREVKKMAKRMDKDGNGVINFEEFLKNEEKLTEYKAWHDTKWFESIQDGEGYVSYDDVVEQLGSPYKINKTFGKVKQFSLDQFLYLTRHASPEVIERVHRQLAREVFKLLDRNDDGFITKEEFVETYREYGLEHPDTALEKMYQKYEPEVEGISYERFLAMKLRL